MESDATAALLVMALAVILGLLVVGRNLRRVPEHHVDVVERLGRYHRTLDPGRHLLTPWIDRVRTRLDTREQTFIVPPAPVITADDAVMTADTAVSYRIVDPVRATYEVHSLTQGLEMLTVTMLRGVMADHDLDRARAHPHETASDLRRLVAREAYRWGLDVTRVELRAIEKSAER